MAHDKSADVSRGSFISGQSQTEVNSSCLNNQGVYCQSCKEVCNEEAIVFDPVQKGIQMPSIITERCTQCHDCMEFCPTGAITISKHKTP